MIRIDEKNYSRLWRALLLNASLGIAFLLVNFPKFLMRTIDANVTSPNLKSDLYLPITFVQNIAGTIIGPAPLDFFERTMTYSFALLWTFIGLTALLSLRRLDIRLLLTAIGGIVLGYTAIHLIAWMAVGVVAVVGAVLFIVKWIAAIVAIITAFIISILKFLFGYWPIALIAVALLVIYRFRSRMGQLVMWALGLGLVTYLLALIIPPLMKWIMHIFESIMVLLHWLLDPVFAFLLWILTPVIRFIVFVAVTLLVALLALGILVVLGNLVVAQLSAGWYAGSGRKGVALGGFAIGSALALILVVGVATPAVADSINSACAASIGLIVSGAQFIPGHQLTDLFLTTLPSVVKDFMFLHMTSIKAPALDSFILLAVLGLANVSVFLKIPRARPHDPEPVPVQFYPAEYVALFGGLLVALLVVFMQALGGETQT